MPRNYVPKATQRCTRCDQRGHNARSKRCPSRVASESVAEGFRVFAEELQRRGVNAGIIAAARAAAESVSQ